MTNCVIDRDREAELWELHFTSPTVETRNALVMLYRELTDRIANNLAKTLPVYAVVNLDDLQDEATTGLIRLIDSGAYDPSRGIRFTTYATQRINGHMLDALRKLDWVPRLERRKEKSGEVDPIKMMSVDMHYRRDRCWAINNYDRPDESETAPEASDRKDVWRETLKGCSKVERLIVLLYYHEELTMKQIGATLGVSESRVSQLHSQLISRLRKQLVAA